MPWNFGHFETPSPRDRGIAGDGRPAQVSGREPWTAGGLSLEDTPQELAEPASDELACSVILDVVAQLPVDAELFVQEYLSQQGYVLKTEGGTVTASRGGTVLTVLFEDEQVVEASASTS